MIRFECRRFLPLVVDLAEGTLPAADRGGVEVHVDKCPECREALVALRKVPASLKEDASGAPVLPDDRFWERQRHEVMRAVRIVDGVMVPERRNARWRTGLAAMAAGVMAAIGVRWGVPPLEPGRTAMSSAREAEVRLARLDAAGNLRLADGLLTDGDLSSGGLRDNDLQALEDFLGTV